MEKKPRNEQRDGKLGHPLARQGSAKSSAWHEAAAAHWDDAPPPLYPSQTGTGPNVTGTLLPPGADWEIKLR